MHAVAAGLRLGVARRPAPYANHKRHDAAHTHAGKRIHTHAHMWIQSATLSHDAFAATPTERRTSRLKYIVCVALTATGGDTCEPCAPAAHTKRVSPHMKPAAASRDACDARFTSLSRRQTTRTR